MKASLSRRLFRTILTIGLVNVGLTLVAIEFIYEDVEDTILRKELAQERRYVEQRILDMTVPAGGHHSAWPEGSSASSMISTGNPSGSKPKTRPHSVHVRVSASAS